MTAGSNYRDWYVTAPTPYADGASPEVGIPCLPRTMTCPKLALATAGTGVVEVHKPFTVWQQLPDWHVTARHADHV